MSSNPPLTFARVNGHNLHYARTQPPSGGDGADGQETPTLVFINSLGTDFRIWNTVIEAFADTWPTLAYDKRGHGLSDAGTYPYSMDDHVEDLLGLLDHLSIDRIVLVGVSVGGLISQGVLKRAPGRALAAVLCDTGHKIGVRAMWDERIETARTQGIEPLADGVLERWFPQSFREGEPEQLAGWRAMLTRTTGTGYAGTSAAIRDTDFTDFVGTISVPVLCITGSHDLATPPDLGRDLASRIPASQFALVEGAGHLPMIDHPDQLIALIREFLTRNVGPASLSGAGPRSSRSRGM